MKNLKSLMAMLLLLMMLTTNAQLGIHGGLNGSYFTGGGQPWVGTGNVIGNLTGGVYAAIPMNKVVFVQAECNYMMTGARNPVEEASFRVRNIVVPVTVGIKLNQFDIQAGIYGSFMLHAESYNFSGVSTFDWQTGDWDYYKERNGGGVVSVGYDFIGMRGQLRMMQSVFKVQDKDYGDHKNLGRDMIVNIEMYVPIKNYRE